MANHVSSYVQFYNEDESIESKLYEYMDGIVEEAKKEAEELQKASENDTYNFGIYGKSVHEMMTKFGIDVPQDEDNVDYQWFIDNVGSKWCYLEDIDGSTLSTTSAWSVPFDFIENLCKVLSEKFPGTFAVVQYEDECYNFIGSALVNDTGVDEVEELESDEVWEKFTEMTGHEVPEDGIWDDDEKTEAYYDWVNDWISESGSNQLKWYREYLVEVREEQELYDKENLSGC